jgi:hypothetical protein
MRPCKRRWTVSSKDPIGRWMAIAEDEETWRELDETLNSVDTFILGRRMYPEYEQYWLSLLDNPNKGTENEIAYARRANKTPISSFPRRWTR